MLRNRLNGRMFHLNQQMGHIFVDNISLQNKIDEIHIKGSGNYGQNVPKGDKSKSLNYTLKKSEALKIDNENIRLAARIINQKPTLSNKAMVKEFNKYQSIKDSLNKKNGIPIENLVKSQKEKFSKKETTNMLFPDIKIKSNQAKPKFEKEEGVKQKKEN